MTINPVFNPIIPAPNSSVAETQKPLNVNFIDIYKGFLKNHIALDDPTNPGNHTVIDLVQQAQDSKTSTGSQEIAIYTKKVDGQTDQVFMRYGANGKEFQLTQYQIYELEQTETQTSFFTFFPGGLIIYFGRVNPTSDSFKLNLNPAICSNFVSVNLCPIGPIPPVSIIRPPPEQSNISITSPNPDGKFPSIMLTNSTTFDVPPNQYYIVVGNL